jgi:hypothetical protein
MIVHTVAKLNLGFQWGFNGALFALCLQGPQPAGLQ